ncbi:MAG: tRNA uridine-5-carboxymethylaminomethyl(34) synthesis GTPase MnmE [Aquificaceae bacterium]
MVKLREPIVAVATPYGISAIGVLRLSGQGVWEKVKEYVRIRSEPKTRHAYLVKLTDESGSTIDQGIMIYYRSPNSYTGEDMIEFSLHGNPLILKKVLELFVRKGVRLAHPGEFTKRAFLNGKMDLVQAEAVADLINAKTELARKAATRQLQGDLSSYVNSLREKMLELLAYIEADIEFSEEDIPTLTKEQTIHILTGVEDGINTLLSTVKKGEFIRKGINLAIVGKPNVGKSSLFNALLGQDRAIVTDIPGTTRDFLQEQVHLDGIPVNLIDTAGIRSTHDNLERLGIQRSVERIKNADLILFVIDSSSPVEREDWEVYNLIKERDHTKVLNKVDLGINPSVVDAFPDAVWVSAKTGEGIGKLKDVMLEKAGLIDEDCTNLYISTRHAAVLEKALSIIQSLKGKTLLEDLSPELLMLDIREALSHLEEVVGIITTEDVLDSIFSRFCIGK